MKVTSYMPGSRHRTDMPEIKMQGSLCRRGAAKDWGVEYLGRDADGRTWIVEISHKEALDILRAAGSFGQEMIDKALAGVGGLKL